MFLSMFALFLSFLNNNVNLQEVIFLLQLVFPYQVLSSMISVHLKTSLLSFLSH